MNTAVPLIISSRHVEAPGRYRPHIAEKLARLERYDRHVIRYEVDLEHEQNPRQSKTCQHIAIRGRAEGRTIRAEARGSDFRAALDAAIGKLEEHLRRTHDRHRVRRDRHQLPAIDPVRT
jgi:ribosomal subunit interface protein